MMKRFKGEAARRAANVRRCLVDCVTRLGQRLGMGDLRHRLSAWRELWQRYKAHFTHF